VRSLLNSWLIPNDTRQPTDRFAEEMRRQKVGRRQYRVARQLRDDLRSVVEGTEDNATVLNGWVSRLEVRPFVEGGRVVFRHRAGYAGDTVACILGSIAEGTWARLKACPDCRWVFYDNTRNGSKRWCLMTAGGPEGRSCGTIDKVRRYRQRAGARAQAEGPG
jgi:CGNR zinc finger